MGKASKWIRGLFGLKKSEKKPDQAQKPPPKKKWSFAKPNKEKGRWKSEHSVVSGAENDNNDNKHAIAVAAATAAVAEAAVAAAQAAAAVVKLTSPGGKASTAGSGGRLNSTVRVGQSGAGYGVREIWAAVTIQSHFRAYLPSSSSSGSSSADALSRRALRALKALVKLQALVRGHLLRKQTTDILRRMQALVRVQARARAGRILSYEYTHKSPNFNHKGPTTPDKFEHITRAKIVRHDQPVEPKRNGSKSIVRSWEQGSFTRIIPMDGEASDTSLRKPHTTPKRKNIFHSSHPSHSSDQYCQSFSTSKDSTAHQTTEISPSSEFIIPLKFPQDVDESAFCTAENSPQFYSASSMGGSSKKGAFTPTKSDGSRSYLSGYSDHPNYMAYTESSKAKMRSFSAPKQRPQYERSSSTNRYSVHGYGDSRFNPHKVSALHFNFANKAYPGSGRLDRLGMPVRGDISSFSGGHWHRYW